ncbi:MULTISPECIES: enoyl-CoA hydratase family protein [Streptomyces]|uniref:enoyl-CoA hydratase family protein n=1 Tax=Streptomyces TaxID=1883 RepID=UPI00103DAD0F|nr:MULTISPECIES: enoyl-CoA hydratase family protein [Streptomyces]MBT3076402.1 enoyl-CoA hydratase family protein [Streptomyces sp. COG21]MBT3079084.1 enoyl-CoA hydratase family protein [Streptomyces sp. COG20]MBT3087954.1 enoyl-CoA hydratase family protein [Streptomyces sp. CYG21]MBT3095274.1 enoyl-CoA hydratase family protein [Streptomyces sp. CBG30]MBT3107048.1 enoyl-CoA hydratase family protein [Streptomyces sp. COG19]
MTLIVRTEERGVVTLTLDSPANRNALSAELVGEVRDSLAACAADDTVRAVVLAHSGSTFCAGADLKAPPDPGAFVGLMREVVALPKPVVARVDGHVRAGGMGLLAACDIAVAGPASTFALTESRLGLAPAVISLTLLPRMDRTAAHRYFLTGERFDAAEAARTGLVTEAAADVDKALVPVLDGVRRASPQGLAASKELVTATVLRSFDQYAEDLIARSAELFASDEAREGMTAFLERRDPVWVR